jgi:hypothetical protein
MKQLILIIVLFWCCNTPFFGQKVGSRLQESGTLFGQKVESGIHTPLGKKVRIGGLYKIDTQITALFVNSVYIGHFAGSCIDPNKIDSIKIMEKPVEINGKSFENQIHCFVSQEFRFVSLQELLEKYRHKDKPLYLPVFMINGTVLIGNNVLSFKVDESCLLELDCTNSDELGYWGGKERFTLVSISTHKPEKLNTEIEPQ